MTARSSHPRRTVQGRRTEIAPIDDPAEQCVVFWKRRGGLISKASALSEHTHAPAAVIVVSSTGKLYSSDDLSVEEMAWIIFAYVHCNGGTTPPMGPKEVVDHAKKEGKCFSNRLTTLSKKASELCTKTGARAAVIVFSKTGSLYAWGFPTVEDVISDWVEKQLESRVAKDYSDLYRCILHYVMLKKSKDISGSGNSGVGAGCDSGSSGKEPMRSVDVGCGFNPHSSLNLSENNPSVTAGAGGHSGVGVGHDYEVFYDNEIHSLYERFEAICLPLLADIETVAGGSFGVESTSTLSDLEGREFVDSSFDSCSGLDGNDCLIPRENSTGRGRSSGEEQGYGYNPDIFSTLGDLDVSLS